MAASVAIVQALALGLVALGADSLVLVAAALAAWVAVRMLVPVPRVSLGSAVAASWRARSRPEQIALGALAGLSLAWTVWLLRHPSIGFDSSLYHYTQVAQWLENGRPGSQGTISHGLPFGSYPLTSEVLQAWPTAIARSFVPLSLLPPLTWLLFAGAGWLALRELGAPRPATGLALAAVLTTPWVVRELNEPLGDLASLAWLATGAALVLAARRRPPLLAGAVVAAGLAVGVKTTALVPALALLAVGGFLLRGRLRPLARPLLAAAVLAGVTGGVWYLRNLFQHGSPTWPFMAAPWGDPVPPFVDLIDTRFSQRPLATLDGRLSEYASVLAGSIVGLVGGALAPALSRRRAVWIAAAVSVGSLVAWTLAPVTGLSETTDVPGIEFWSLSTTRYLLPAATAGAAALALAARAGRFARGAALGALAVACLWNLAEVGQLGLPFVPRARVPLAGIVAGAAAAACLPLLRGLPRPPRRLGQAAVPAAALSAGLLMALAAPGYLERHGTVRDSTSVDGRRLTVWFARQPAFEHDDEPVYTAGRFLSAQLAGAGFQHRLELLPRDASCREVARAAERGWLVVQLRVTRGVLGVDRVPAADCRPPFPPLYDDGAFRVYAR
ncbi:MAG TPA: hypothetical protein VK304_11265 [Thermoleophilaceae bacterium]|nr:hypothetical protein [Thermoleophilaceae bacterium]